MMVMLEQSLLTWKQDRDLRTALSMSPVCLESCLEMEPEQEDAASPQPEDEKSSWRKQRKCPESPRRIQKRKYRICPTNVHLPIIRYYIVCEAYQYSFKC